MTGYEAEQPEQKVETGRARTPAPLAIGDISRQSKWVYSALMRIRPAQLGDFIKKCLRIRRRYVQGRRIIMWVDPVSIFGLEFLAIGMFESQMTRLFELVLRSGDLVVDSGANEGYFSLLASLLVGEKGQIHSVEPQTRLQHVLRRNCDVNHARSITIHQTGFLDKPGDVDLFLRPSTLTGGSSVVKRERQLGSAKERIPITTFDRFHKEYGLGQIRLLKVDCEGAERRIIDGAAKTIDQGSVDFIALEFHPQICGLSDCNAAHGRLISAGYVLSKSGMQCVYHLPRLQSSLAAWGAKTAASWNE